MQVSSLFKSFIFSLAFLLFISCEEEGEPLTLEDIYEATNGNKTPFKAKINGFDYTADLVAGAKEGNTFFIVGSQYSSASITISTLGISPGLYLGEDSMSNSILFKNNEGRQFFSNTPDQESDAIISIRSFSEKNALATGVFSGTLYSLDSDEMLEITNGEFNSVFLEIPFFGEMTAIVNNKTYSADECTVTAQQNGNLTLSTIASSANFDTLGIRFIIEDTLEVKNYDLEDQVASATYNTNTFSANIFKHQYNSSTGYIRISKIDSAENRVLGTFSFEAKSINGESVSVKSGSFEALIK